jgi:hypothetical protein
MAVLLSGIEAILTVPIIEHESLLDLEKFTMAGFTITPAEREPSVPVLERDSTLA